MLEPADNGGRSGDLIKRSPLSRVNCSPLSRHPRHGTRSGMENSDDPQHTPEATKNDLVALSPRELAARRANAKKCTGPRTNEGRATRRPDHLQPRFFAPPVVHPELD